MATFDLNTFSSALADTNEPLSGVDFTGKSLKLDTAEDAKPIIEAINNCPRLDYLTLTGNTLGVEAAKAIARALATHPELKMARWADMFTGRMKTEIPPALKALGEGMIEAGARLSILDLSDNAFGPIGVEGLAKLLESEVCTQLQELRLNNNGLGITGGKLLGKALSSPARPRLRVFVAGRNRLENDGAKALANVFQSMGSLEEISMPQNGIYHPGVTALSTAFKHNPQLRSLNLNDNTVGAKGAGAIAEALPALKNLKHVNFGDCLLKSKGASTLAKAFKDNSVPLETLDLSHNEIGREACMEVVDSITHSPGGKKKLTKVVLAGNSLGGSAKKKEMRDKLGEAAELSEGEDEDEEYVTGSEEGSDSDTESEGDVDESNYTNDSTIEHDLSAVIRSGHTTLDESAVRRPLLDEGLHTWGDLANAGLASVIQTCRENAAAHSPSEALSRLLRHPREDMGSCYSFKRPDTTRDKERTYNYTYDSTIEHDLSAVIQSGHTTLDESGMEDVVADVSKFLENPSLSHFKALGSNPAQVIDTHLQSIQDPTQLIQAYIEATLKISGLTSKDSSVLPHAFEMYEISLKKAGEKHAMQWVLANSMLVGLGLIKTEDKNHKITWDLQSCYDVLNQVIDKEHFPRSLADTLRFFIQSKKDTILSKYGVNFKNNV